ncbi:CinA family protein [Microbacterium sp. RD1]|uniref:CinA family protein n=1 Tax=Microbacterium sp. RD1 TaxID=3457313 RepID=UPI003FA61008
MDLVDELAHVVADSGLTIAVAESLSSGALSSAIGRGEGASEWFAGGVVAYQVSSKHRALGVDADIDPCSARCAMQMADGVRATLGADLAVSITGVGGPEPEDGHAAGTVYIGISSGDAVDAELHEFDGDPAEVISQSVERALTLLVARSKAHAADG